MYEDAETSDRQAETGACEPRSNAMADAVAAARRLAGIIGADNFNLFFVALNGDGRRLVPVFDSEFPGISLFSRTLSAKALEPLACLLGEAVQPVWWRPTASLPLLTEAARSWTIEIDSPAENTQAIAFPVAIERLGKGVIVFAGINTTIDEDALCDIHAQAHGLLADVARLRMPESARLPVMSRREIECLNLTASGLTSDSIASALGLSVHTANQYLTNSTHKLNAVNRIHAVAKALRSGLID